MSLIFLPPFFMCSVIYYWTDTQQHGIHLLYIPVTKKWNTNVIGVIYVSVLQLLISKNPSKCESKYLLLIEFEVCTVSYGQFFPLGFLLGYFMARALCAWAINLDGKKWGSVTYSTDQENEVSKMFILSRSGFLEYGLLNWPITACVLTERIIIWLGICT